MDRLKAAVAKAEVPVVGVAKAMVAAGRAAQAILLAAVGATLRPAAAKSSPFLSSDSAGVGLPSSRTEPSIRPVSRLLVWLLALGAERACGAADTAFGATRPG